jgi:hypothetical protein
MDAQQLLRPFVVRGSGAARLRPDAQPELSRGGTEGLSGATAASRCRERRSSTLERPSTARGCPAYRSFPWGALPMQLLRRAQASHPGASAR